MAEENSEQRAENSEQETVAQPATQNQTPPTTQTPTQAPPKQGMSSGAKWGIGIGACCCCVIILVILFFILGFAGCSMVRNFGGYNWPSVPPMEEGTEIPIPSFSNIR